MNLDPSVAREKLLETVNRFAKAGSQCCEVGSLIQEVSSQLTIQNQPEAQQAILTMFHDLFRTGHLAWGMDAANAAPPWFHVTEQGRRALRTFSRDPANPDGYLNSLSSKVTLNPIAQSYIEEALRTYTSDCVKATAVMVGCAAESLSLELRDTLIAKLTADGKSVRTGLTDWRIKTVLDSLTTELEQQKRSMDRSLREAFESFWLAFTGQVRRIRNDAGHPLSIEPVTQETVHAALLIFPDLAELSKKLRDWIAGHTF